MERREQYDPEDIESLLSERGFDELLAEERAFVLRHLSGREEYEQMRALLHFVRPDERARPTIEPEDRIRTNVLAAFRAQQQPQWRVWLNSITVWAAPREDRGFWRPALAFASLALLIVVGVVAVRQFGAVNDSAQLAEVEQVHTQQDRKGTMDTTVLDLQAPAEEESIQAATEVSSGAASISSAANAEEPAPPTLEMDIAEYKYAERVESTTTDAVQAIHPQEDLAAAAAKEEQKDFSFSPAATGSAVTTAPGVSHVVTLDELVRNESVANVSAVSKASKTRKIAADAEKALDQDISASRSLGQDPALLGLISSGW